MYTKDEIVEFYQDEVGEAAYNDWIKDLVYKIDEYDMLYTGKNNIAYCRRGYHRKCKHGKWR